MNHFISSRDMNRSVIIIVIIRIRYHYSESLADDFTFTATPMAILIKLDIIGVHASLLSRAGVLSHVPYTNISCLNVFLTDSTALNHIKNSEL